MRARERRYLALMGACILLILLAWNVIRFWSIPAAPAGVGAHPLSVAQAVARFAEHAV